jgi:type IV pilus assembly protein PilQ
MAVIMLFSASCSTGGSAARTDKDVAPTQGVVLQDVTVAANEGTVDITVKTSQTVPYSLYQQDDPLRLVLDLPRTAPGEFSRNIPVNSGMVGFIKPVAAPGGNTSLEFFLTGPSRYEIDGAGGKITLSILPSDAEEAEAPAGTPAAAVEKVPPLPDETIESRPIVQAAAAAPAAATAPAAAAATETAAAARFVTGLNVRKDPSGTLAVIRGDGELQYEYFLVEGKSLVFDIFEAGNKIWPTVHNVDDAYIEQIRIGEHFQPEKKVRVVFDLKIPGEYHVTRGESGIQVAFGSPEEATMASAGTGVAMNTVSEVYFRPLDGKSRIEIKTGSRPEFKVVDSEDPLRLIVEVGNARIEPSAQKTLDLSRLNRSVTKITAFEYERDDRQVVRVVAQLKEAVPYRVAAVGDTIAIDINGLSGMTPVMATPEEGPVTSVETEVTASPAPAVPQGTPASMTTPAAAADAESGSEGSMYTGTKLSLDFMDADITDILRLISDVSGLNFVSGPEVKGRVTIRLADVPWDQALDIILKTNVPTLARIRESDNIVRITTLAKIQDEEEAKRRAAEQTKKNLEAQKKLEPLVTRSFSISYAKIADIEHIVRQFTSERVDQDGLLTIDERTGTIIVRDLKENVDEIGKTIEALDTPTPAVLVEARIVEMTSNEAKDLGVQWGLNFSADPAHGNALPVAFPNSIGIGGGVGMTGVTGAGGGGTTGMVNLPASGATSGIGISFGHIANTLSLDLRLTAMESMGKTKILSTPRVLVVQNETAKINVGQELPIPSTDAEGNRTVQWREVGILLDVKPQVTNDGRIFMEIRVEKASQGDPVPTTEGLMFSINSNKAETQVLIADGETAVIGGLSEEGIQEQTSQTPGLGSIPGLGWLFRQQGKSEVRKELMIFLTPKIVKVH